MSRNSAEQHHPAKPQQDLFDRRVAKSSRADFSATNNHHSSVADASQSYALRRLLKLRDSGAQKIYLLLERIAFIAKVFKLVVQMIGMNSSEILCVSGSL